MALDWDKLRLFGTIAEAGSLTEAARRLNLSQPVLSRHLRGLEAVVGAALFHRHARGLVLTYEGERLFAAIKGIDERVEGTLRELAEGREHARGQLSLTTTVSFGSVWLAPRLPHFFARYPEMRLSLILSDAHLDLSTRQAEVAIRFQASNQADLIQRALVSVQHNLYASADYLARRGTPQSIADLDKHDLITYGPDAPLPIQNVNWVLRLGDPPSPRLPLLTIDNIYGLKKAVLAGLGIAALPDYLVRDNEETAPLVHLLPDVKGPRFQTYFVYPSELKGSRRVIALRDFLLEEVGASGGSI